MLLGRDRFNLSTELDSTTIVSILDGQGDTVHIAVKLRRTRCTKGRVISRSYAPVYERLDDAKIRRVFRKVEIKLH